MDDLQAAEVAFQDNSRLTSMLRLIDALPPEQFDLSGSPFLEDGHAEKQRRPLTPR